MSSTTESGDDGGSTRKTIETTVSQLPIPTSRAFWFIMAIGGVLIYAGMFVVTGEATGLVGLWGISLILATLLAYVSYAVWSALG
jgi:hypothetical protein